MRLWLENGDRLDRVFAAFTLQEARELMEALQDYLEDEDLDQDGGWHYHIGWDDPGPDFTFGIDKTA